MQAMLEINRIFDAALARAERQHLTPPEPTPEQERRSLLAQRLRELNLAKRHLENEIEELEDELDTELDTAEGRAAPWPTT